MQDEEKPFNDLGSSTLVGVRVCTYLFSTHSLTPLNCGDIHGDSNDEPLNFT